MIRDEYERAKARIEEEHRAAVELLETARKAQLRALDLVWMVQGEERGAGNGAASDSAPTATAATEGATHPDPPRRKTSPELADEIIAVYRQLPETFTRHDVFKVLGYEPERATLYRSLLGLVEKGLIRVEEAGTGHRAAIYRRTPKEPSDPT